MFRLQGTHPAGFYYIPMVGTMCSQGWNDVFPWVERCVPWGGTITPDIWKREGAVVDRRHTRYSPDMLACVAYGLLLPPPRFMSGERGELQDSGTSCIAAVLNVHPHLTVEELSPWRLQDVLRFLNLLRLTTGAILQPIDRKSGSIPCRETYRLRPRTLYLLGCHRLWCSEDHVSS